MPFPARVGRYEIKSRIGGGGMGTLYLARDTNPTTDRLVALKLLNANLEHGDLRARFSREARSLSALSHPNIVIIHDSGEFQGAPYIVMEYVRGESLAEKIRRRAPLSLGQKVRIMAELCDGLAHAHGAGIIHRDIKPANLMVDQHGRLKILDFGIAREGDGRHQGGAPLTRLHTAIGTPGYMSPEQIEGGAIDHRADLFSAGTVCYELLAYREAFVGATTRQIEKRVMHDDPPPLESLVPGLDPRLVEIIALAMKKEPGDRAQSAGELLDGFARVQARLAPDEQPTHVTPLPSLEASGGRESRRHRAAEIAHQRAVASKAEGALDFARRSALEALAENPEHQGARVLLRELGGEPEAAAAIVEPTEFSHSLEYAKSPDYTVSGVPTVVIPPGSKPKRPAAPLPWRPARQWMRFAPIAGAAIVALALFGVAVAFRDRWLPANDAPLGSVVVKEAVPVAPTAPADDGAAIVATTLIATLQDAQGVPVNEAEVTLNPGNVSASGNGFGQYLFESIAPGPYTLTARHRSFKERAVTVEVVAGGVQHSIVLDRVARMENSAGPLRDPKRPPGDDYRGPYRPPAEPPYRPPADPRRDTGAVGGPNPPPADPAGPREAPSLPTQSSVLAQDALERAIRALNEDGDIDRAERLVAEAQRLDPGSKDVAREAERLREFRAVERRQRVRDHVLRAQRLFREVGDLDGALREVDKALALLPADPQAVALREDILRVKAIGAKKPLPLVTGPAAPGHARTFEYSEHR